MHKMIYFKYKPVNKINLIIMHKYSLNDKNIQKKSNRQNLNNYIL